MKSIFVLYGALALTGLAAYLLDRAWARGALIAICFLGIWYLPFGTIANLLVLTLLFTGRRKHAASTPV